MRTEITLNAIATELQRNCGDILAAAKAVGVSLIFINQWRKDDEEADKKLTEAERVGTQGLVSAAIQRAVHGVPKGVYFKGIKVDEETVYSDGLLTTLLKAKVPEFAKDTEGGGVHVQVNVANLMPRATSYEQWLSMKSQTFSDAQRQLAPPIDAEYVEIQPLNVFQGIDL